ncbi:hypothetical protein GWY41_14445 [Salmonella enterica subsp. enterica serovar Bredeney]|nr:hypothetical protein [Salmonella enterica subsp. enterica serovar Bredeney]EDR7301331.1 hypothetical protein [Salmonella enterica subsp. enterica serovar Bredeney]EEB7406814.1 hypothetical protein [Salmonella enterica]EEG1541196.1 hypothetical protein [Salmonella enterica subsp. enterica serovar Bredeney]EJB7648975.1 hypothetical protein [Salmonella enterica]
MKDFRNGRKALNSNTGIIVKNFVGELTEEISIHLERSGIKNYDAHKIANAVVDKLRESMGGCQLYFPKLNQKDNSERNAEIFKEYKRGAFVNELAIKYNVSLQAIYNAIKKEREREEADAENYNHRDVYNTIKRERERAEASAENDNNGDS